MKVTGVASKGRNLTEKLAHKTKLGDDDDEPPYDGSEPGYDPTDAAPSISRQEREIASRFQRPGSYHEEKESHPLTPLQKTVTNGKDIKVTHTMELAEGQEGLCTSINWSKDTMAVGTRDAKIVLVDLHNAKLMDTIDISQGRKNPPAVTGVRFRKDTAGAQNVLLVAQGSDVHHIHASSGKVLSSISEGKNEIQGINYRADGQVFATCGSDTVVRVYDDKTGQCFCTLDHGDDISTTGHTNNVYSVVFKPDDPKILVSGGWDQTLQIWDLRVHRSVKSIFGPYVCGDAIDIKGSQILVGSYRFRHPLQLYDMASCQLMTNLPFHQPAVDACLLYSARFGQGKMDKYIFAGGSGTKPCVKMFQQTGELVGTVNLPSSCHSIDTVGEPDLQMVAMCCATSVSLLEVK